MGGVETGGGDGVVAGGAGGGGGGGVETAGGSGLLSCFCWTGWTAGADRPKTSLQSGPWPVVQPKEISRVHVPLPHCWKEKSVTQTNLPSSEQDVPSVPAGSGAGMGRARVLEAKRREMATVICEGRISLSGHRIDIVRRCIPR